MDKDIQRDMQQLCTTLKKLFKDDAHETKLEYSEKEVGIMNNHEAVNERIMQTRYKKVMAFQKLNDNWEDFKSLYANDNIMTKIGMEILENKMYFDDKVLKTIQEYPARKQVLYYFKKNETIDMPQLPSNAYEIFSQKILADVGPQAQEQLQHKEQLLKGIQTKMDDKSQNNLQYLSSLTSGTHPQGKINVEEGNLLVALRDEVKNNNFIVKQIEDKLLISLPIASIKNDSGTLNKYNNITLVSDGKNIEAIMPGNMEPPITKSKVLENMRKMGSNVMSIKGNTYGM